MKRVIDLRELAAPAFLLVAALGAATCSFLAESILGDVLRHLGVIRIAGFSLRFVLPVLLAGVLGYAASRQLYRHTARSSALSSLRTHVWHACLCYATLLWLVMWLRHCSASSPCYPDVMIAGVELALSALAVAAADVLARFRPVGRMAPVA
jgi:hypothetical protein